MPQEIGIIYPSLLVQEMKRVVACAQMEVLQRREDISLF